MVANKIYTSRPPEVFYSTNDRCNPVWYKANSRYFFDESHAERVLGKFERLKSKWTKETVFLSNPKFVYDNDNYKKIIKLGVDVVPYLLNDLKNNNSDWLFALKEILKIDPILPEHIGFFNLMKNDWLNWAKSMGYEYGYNDIIYTYQFGDSLPQLI